MASIYDPSVSAAALSQLQTALGSGYGSAYGATQNGAAQPTPSAPSGSTGFQFPNYNMPGFPYQNLPQQIASAFVPPNQQFSNGSQYGRWNGVNNNAFGLFPNQFGGLFGYQPQGGGMAFQPPYANMNGFGAQGQASSQPMGMDSLGGAPSQSTPQQPSGAMNGLGLPSGGGVVNNSPFQVPQMYDPQTGGFDPVHSLTPGTLGYYQGQPPGMSQMPSGQMPTMQPQSMGLLGNQPNSQGVTQSGGNYQAPSIPTGGPQDNTAYSSRFMPTGANTQSAELQHALASGRLQGSYAQNLGNMPQSFSPAQFNQVAQQNPVLAEAMAAQMPQAGRNAIMAQNGWSNDQMNNFLNAYGSGAQPGFGPAQLAQLRSLGIG